MFMPSAAQEMLCFSIKNILLTFVSSISFRSRHNKEKHTAMRHYIPLIRLTPHKEDMSVAFSVGHRFRHICDVRDLYRKKEENDKRLRSIS